MFASCSRRAVRLQHAPRRCFVSQHAQTDAAAPERTRKFANSSASPPPKPLFRRFLVGLVVGAGIVGGWQIYRLRTRDDSFLAYTLGSQEPVSSTASIFHLQPKHPSPQLQAFQDARRKGIWNVHFKQPQLQIVRSYTPLPPESGTEGTTDGLRFLIRRDPHGEVSSYLHRLALGAEIEVRGPNLEYELSPEVKQVIFLAGGTGIAPALQVAHALFEGPTSAGDGQPRKDRKLHILWANRMREDCLGGVSDAPPIETVPPKPTWSGFFTKPRSKPPPAVSAEKGAIVRALEALRQTYPGQVTVEYYVNAEDSWIDEDAVMRALSRFDAKDFSTGAATQHDERQLLISGPPGFIAHLAGPKEWRNGREEQGAVSRIVAHAISKHPHHIKVWKI